ncbi:MAG: hypothetical protein ACI845_001990, partial [Gammaproteobacteria bacterium]
YNFNRLLVLISGHSAKNAGAPQSVSVGAG